MRQIRIGAAMLAAAAMVFSFSVAASTEPAQSSSIEYEMALKSAPFVPASPPVINGAATVYSANTTTGATYTRALENCSALSGVGVGVRFHTQSFTVSAAGNYAVSSVQTGFDGFIFVYTGSFNPANALTNCTAGNDDGAGGIGTSDIASVALVPGTTYIVVTTGFAPADFGAFTNSISGPGVITLVGVAADLALTQSNDAAGNALLIGNTFQKTLTVTNNGPAAATNIAVTDTLPPQLTFVSSNCGAVAAGQVVTFTIATLANGESSNCRLTVRVASSGTIVNTGSITASTPADPTSANNTSTAQIGPTGGGIAQTAVPALDRNMVLVLLGLVSIIGMLAMRQRQA